MYNKVESDEPVYLCLSTRQNWTPIDISLLKNGLLEEKHKKKLFMSLYLHLQFYGHLYKYKGISLSLPTV